MTLPTGVGGFRIPFLKFLFVRFLLRQVHPSSSGSPFVKFPLSSSPLSSSPYQVSPLSSSPYQVYPLSSSPYQVPLVIFPLVKFPLSSSPCQVPHIKFPLLTRSTPCLWFHFLFCCFSYFMLLGMSLDGSISVIYGI